MLCGKCKEPLLCKYCGETEHSRRDKDGPYVCICERFIYEDCQECAKVKEYVNKDAMWYIKSIFEAILILIGTVCFLGFVIGMIFVLIGIPMVWGKPLSYHPFPWLNMVLAVSICVGLVDILFLISFDSHWREEYEDHSMVFPIKEKINES
jgi:hypothetical protein